MTCQYCRASEDHSETCSVRIAPRFVWVEWKCQCGRCGRVPVAADVTCLTAERDEARDELMARISDIANMSRESESLRAEVTRLNGLLAAQAAQIDRVVGERDWLKADRDELRIAYTQAEMSLTEVAKQWDSARARAKKAEAELDALAARVERIAK